MMYNMLLRIGSRMYRHLTFNTLSHILFLR